VYAEALVKIGDSTGDPRASWRDGQVIVVRPEGVHVTPEEYLLWLRSETEPAQFSALAASLRAPHERWIACQRYCLSDAFDVGEVMAARGQSKDDALRLRDEAKRMHDRALAEGYDTNWGYQDLRVHAAVLVQVGSLADVEEMLHVPSVPGLHPTAPRWRGPRRASRLPYERFISGETLERIRDPKERVSPPRHKSRELAVPAVQLLQAMKE